METKKLGYNISVTTIQKSGWFDVERNCNGFTITNIGDNTVEVNDQIFYPGVIGTNLGDSRSFGGNEGEIYLGRIKVSFRAPQTALQNIEIVQKIYVD